MFLVQVVHDVLHILGEKHELSRLTNIFLLSGNETESVQTVGHIFTMDKEWRDAVLPQFLEQA